MTNHRILVGLVPLVIIVSAACTDDQRRSLGEEDVRDSLRASVERVLEDHGGAPDGDLECTATIGADGAVDAACTGRADDGAAISGSYVGTADVEAETCTAELTVAVGPTDAPVEPAVDCFAV